MEPVRCERTSPPRDLRPLRIPAFPRRARSGACPVLPLPRPRSRAGSCPEIRDVWAPHVPARPRTSPRRSAAPKFLRSAQGIPQTWAIGRGSAPSSFPCLRLPCPFLPLLTRCSFHFLSSLFPGFFSFFCLCFLFFLLHFFSPSFCRFSFTLPFWFPFFSILAVLFVCLFLSSVYFPFSLLFFLHFSPSSSLPSLFLCIFSFC